MDSKEEWAVNQLAFMNAVDSVCAAIVYGNEPQMRRERTASGGRSQSGRTGPNPLYLLPCSASRRLAAMASLCISSSQGSVKRSVIFRAGLPPTIT